MTAPESDPIDADLVRGLAALVGLDLSHERADELVPQAEPHFALLRTLTAENPATEPAAEFRLDSWTPDGRD